MAAVLLAFLVLASSIYCFADTNATVSGFVTDAQARVVAGAKVVLTNVNTGLTYAIETNGSGFYRQTGLPPGIYWASVSKEGFARIVKDSIELHVQDDVSLDFSLRVGLVSQDITVEGGVPLVNTESAAVSTVVDRQFVANLPLNGRSFQALIDLTPGVVITPAQIGNEGQFSTDGQRTDTNYFTVDGVSANIGTDQGGSGTLYRNASGTLPGFSILGGTNNLVSVDAMQEFRIQTSNFAPEYGRTPGAQISIVTRSGTNQIHGTLFDYFRNDVLDATDWFAHENHLPKAEERQNDFGGVVGGPIIKDKTFFFFSYEGLRLRLPQTTLTDVPSLTERSSAPADIQPFLNIFPIPNGPEITGTGLAPFNASFSNKATLNAYSIRVDDAVNNHLSLFGRYNYSPSQLLQRAGDSFSVNTIFDDQVRTTTVTVGAVWTIKPSLVNETRFNFSRNLGESTNLMDDFGGAVIPSNSILFPAPLTGPTSDITNLVVNSGLNTAYNLGPNINSSLRQINIVDNVAFSEGSHGLKFGFDYRWVSPNFIPFTYYSSVDFLDMPSLVSTTPNPYYVFSSLGLPGTFYFHNFSFFGQDGWKVNSKLTLTYGLRWDINPAPSANKTLLAVNEVNDPTNTALAPLGTSLWHTTYHNFAPRIGVAYLLRSSQGWDTVLRGGFGVFYDLGDQAAGRAANVFNYPYGANNFLLGEPLGGPVLPFPLTHVEAPPSSVTLTPPLSITAFNPNLEMPYTLQWNLAVEQSLGTNQAFSLSYVGSAGRRLQEQQDIVSPNNTFSTLYVITNGTYSNYDSLQAQFRRRLSRGLQSMISYTWSHSIDDASSAFSSLEVSGSDIIAPGFSNRGPSDWDIRNTLSAAVMYDLPAPHQNPVLQAIFGNWSTDNIVQARSAPPVDVNNGMPINFNPTEQIVLRPDVVPGQPLYLYGPYYPGGKALNYYAFANPPINSVTGFPERQGDLGRNALRGFGATQWDFAVRRRFPIHDTLNLQFRAEMFNVLNHPNFGPPTSNTSVPPSQFGVATQMLGASLGQGYGTGLSPLYQIGGPRSIQLALKLIF
ncbi:MAG TPA: carboxypeptidase regulatory-like domain-containing protein [Terriglobales bacterium]|nr:carboxypeptidase regulatory-like domain-containing protein [Terriglobales bacterium]